MNNWNDFLNYVAGLLPAHEQLKWLTEFSPAVQNHIDNYVEKQYGGERDVLSQQLPQIAIYSCDVSIEKYKARFKHNQRPYNDGRDCIKRAHYAQLRAQYRGEMLPIDVSDAIDAFRDWVVLGE